MAPPRAAPAPSSSKPVHANFSSEKITIGAGVAIFHLASERVVVCYHSRDRYWFLPKGRRNVGEETGEAAIREGFEESGYRCRLLPLPLSHRQPAADDTFAELGSFATEPLWTQLLPQSSTAQYILFWYAAETVSEDVEVRLNAATDPRHEPQTETETNRDDTTADLGGLQLTEQRRRYVAPPSFGEDLEIVERMAQDIFTEHNGTRKIYEPRRHEGTGVDEEELLYESYLLPILEARRKLKGTIMEDVVRRAWEAVLLRKRMEANH